MATLLLNRDFQLPADGFYQLAPLGEFPHKEAGVVQVIDAAAIAAMVNRFNDDKQRDGDKFAGTLVDVDHFSLSNDKPSAAAGWIMALENREDGLWAQIRWTSTGKAAVEGGEYRFLSPVWNREDCAELGKNRVRPLRIRNAAVTNDPNLKGLTPMSNRRTAMANDGTSEGAIKGWETRRGGFSGSDDVSSPEKADAAKAKYVSEKTRIASEMKAARDAAIKKENPDAFPDEMVGAHSYMHEKMSKSDSSYKALVGQMDDVDKGHEKLRAAISKTEHGKNAGKSFRDFFGNRAAVEKETSVETMKNVAEALKIDKPDQAGEEAVIAKIKELIAKLEKYEAAEDAVKNRAAELEARANTAEAKLADIQAEKDLDEFAHVFTNRAEAKAALLANRDATLALWKTVKKPEANPEKNALPNRADTKPVESADAEKSAQRAQAISNRAREIQAKNKGQAWQKCFELAERELNAPAKK